MRLLIYWSCSLVAGGLVAALAHLHGYSGGYDGFWPTFGLFAMPVPMGFGIFHIPALAVGSIICGRLSKPGGRKLTYLLFALFFIALTIHAGLEIFSGDGLWGYMVIGTVDLGVLALIGMVVAD